MPNQSFDTIIIGSGTSAYYAADGLVTAGRRIAMIDDRPWGGTCALRGCQPKKYLVAHAEAIAMASHLVGRGIVASPESDWSALQALKNEFLDGIPERSVSNWEERGVSTFHERARLTGPNEVTAGSDVLSADHIVLATGATPRRAEIPGREHIHISDDFLSLPAMPKRIGFIGGGYISLEFAHVALRSGAEEVTVLHRSARPLKGFDSDMVDVVIEASRAEGMNIILEESPVSVEEEEGTLRIQGSSGATYDADFIVEATGRTPNLSVLDGDAGKVEATPRGIVVNEFLQSVSNPAVYAIGDCTASGAMLAPVADEEGKTAATNIIEGNTKPVDYSVVPSAVFTIPNLASVGLTEESAREKGLDVRVNRGTTTGWPSSKRIGEKHAGYKILIDKETGLIVGAHLVRHNASEVINAFALAIKYGIPAGELEHFLWAYPTMTSDLKNMVG